MSTLEDSLERFRADLGRLGLPGGPARILAAVSGGPDSTALARLLALVRETSHPHWSLSIGHVHHGLRGPEADADRDFVRDLAGALKLPFLEARADVKALARSKRLSTEAAAREARHGAFEAWAREHRLDFIAVAHTADDQVETVLLRVFRRAGLRGLAGMPESRPLAFGRRGPSPLLIRPLLSWRREEVVELLRALGQPYREDSTNRDVSIPRNRIRHRLLPLLREEFDPDIDGALLEVARQARGATGDLERLAAEALQGLKREGGQGWLELDRDGLAALPFTLRHYVLSAATAAPDQRRLAELAGWIGEPITPGPRKLSLGGGIEAELERTAVVLRHASGVLPRVPPPEAELPLPGRIVWDEWEIRAEELASPPPVDGVPGEGGGPILSETVDRRRIDLPLRVRPRRPGDRLRPLGAGGSQKLKKILQERGVDRRRRDLVPIVEDARGIVWVVGHRLADDYRVNPDTRVFVRLEARRLDET